MSKNKFTFEPGTHKYHFNDIPMPGVTTILGVIAKPALIGWAANEAVDYIESVGNDDFDEEYIAVTKEQLKEARTAYAQKRDKAGDIGTAVHNHIEDYVKSEIKGEIHQFIFENELEEKMVMKFVEWAEEEDIEFLLSEQKVYSKEHWYAGTVDLVFKKDGKTYLGDIKTAKQIYDDNYLQMAAYHICLEELGKVKGVAGYCVINLPKELYKKTGEAKRKVQYSYIVNEAKDAFLNCLQLYKFKKKRKTYGKD